MSKYQLYFNCQYLTLTVWNGSNSGWYKQYLIMVSIYISTKVAGALFINSFGTVIDFIEINTHLLIISMLFPRLYYGPSSWYFSQSAIVFKCSPREVQQSHLQVCQPLERFPLPQIGCQPPLTRSSCCLGISWTRAQRLRPCKWVGLSVTSPSLLPHPDWTASSLFNMIIQLSSFGKWWVIFYLVY